MRTCEIDGCASKHYSRGWCKAHYERWKRHGDPLGARTYTRRPLVERIIDRCVTDDNGCLIFQGVSRKDGYGAVATGGRGSPKVLAHRAMWEHRHGPIPDGYEVHHKCKVRACCNVEHLVALTVENHKHAHRHDRCAKGHANWRIRRNGERECRTCATIRERERVRRLRQVS